MRKFLAEIHTQYITARSQEPPAQEWGPAARWAQDLRVAAIGAQVATQLQDWIATECKQHRKIVGHKPCTERAMVAWIWDESANAECRSRAVVLIKGKNNTWFILEPGKKALPSFEPWSFDTVETSRPATNTHVSANSSQ